MELSDIFELLSSELRIEVIRMLREDARINIGEVSEDPEDRLQLLHNHLPRLEGHRVIIYDGTSGYIARGTNYKDIREVLEAVEGD